MIFTRFFRLAIVFKRWWRDKAIFPDLPSDVTPSLHFGHALYNFSRHYHVQKSRRWSIQPRHECENDDPPLGRTFPNRLPTEALIHHIMDQNIHRHLFQARGEIDNVRKLKGDFILEGLHIGKLKTINN